MTLAHATVDVAEMRALLERVGIVGPLTAYDCGEYGSDVDDAEGTALAHTTGAAASPLAALIVAAINALPALLDRLERAEKVSGEARTYMDALAAFSAACDSADDLPTMTYDRHQSTVAAARASLRAALDDEAPR